MSNNNHSFFFHGFFIKMDFDTIFIYSFYMFCVTDTQEEERCKKKKIRFFLFHLIAMVTPCYFSPFSLFLSL